MVARDNAGLATCGLICFAQVACGGEPTAPVEPRRQLQATVGSQVSPDTESDTPWTPPWTAPWAVSAVITSIDGPATTESGRVLRVGLRNLSDSSRMICVAEFNVFVDGPGIGLGGAAEIRDCTAESSFAWVLAGQTSFAVVPLEQLILQSPSADLALQLRVLEAPLDSPTTRREQWLEWGGKVGDALEAGQQLLR